MRVLWGEIGRFIRTAKQPLIAAEGGPIVLNHQQMRKVINRTRENPDGEVCPISYCKGMVASADSIASLGGHHAGNFGDGVPRTLLVVDEASSVNDDYIKICRPWAKRILVIGNAWPCDNFFKHAIKGKPGTEDRGGDVQRADGIGCHRRVLRIRAVDSPNVRLALLERDRGKTPSGRMVLQGVKDWPEYQKNLATWDKHQQTVSLDAEFYEGAEIKLFPEEWRLRAGCSQLAKLCRSHPAEAIGIDSGEGVASTSLAAVNRYGVKEVVSMKTPDTSVIPREIVAFGSRHGVKPENWILDRGGGGKQHADQLRSLGYRCRTIAFGEAVTLMPKRGLTAIETRVDVKEDQSAYKNRRAEMYGELSLLIDPGQGPRSFKAGWPEAFAIPYDTKELVELQRQLAPIPKCYVEGKLELPPKNRRPGQDANKVVTLVDMLGCSPDEADAVVLAVHGMLHKSLRAHAGVVA